MVSYHERNSATKRHVFSKLTVKKMAQEIPRGVTGGWKKGRGSQLFGPTIPTVNGTIANSIQFEYISFGDLDPLYFANDAIGGVVEGCPFHVFCQAYLRAPALTAPSCISHAIPVNYKKPVNDSTGSNTLRGDMVGFSSTAFLIDISLLLDGMEQVNLITGYSDTQDCIGTFNYTICSLSSAIGEYNVLIHENKVKFQPKPPRIIALANNTGVSYDWQEKYQGHPSTLAGIVANAYSQWVTSVMWIQLKNDIYEGGYNQKISMPFTNLATSREECPSFEDPQASVLQDLNRLMFIYGAISAQNNRRGLPPGKSSHSFIRSHLDPDLPLRTQAQGRLQGTHNVFQTNLHWFAAAAVVELVCIACILPTYFGWWRLGRSVSFSPLETAKVRLTARNFNFAIVHKLTLT